MIQEWTTSVYWWNIGINSFLRREIVLSRTMFQISTKKNDNLMKYQQSMSLKANTAVNRINFQSLCINETKKDVLSRWYKFFQIEKDNSEETDDDNLLALRIMLPLEEGKHHCISSRVRIKTWEHQFRHYSSLWAKSNSANANVTKKNSWGSPEAEKSIVHFNFDFSETMKTYDSLLVFYHTSWCAVCKKLKPLYGAAALKMKEENIPGTLGALDLTNNMELADVFNVVAVPIMRYYRNGIFMKTYDGKRETNDIINFMKNPPIKTVIAKVIDV